MFFLYQDFVCKNSATVGQVLFTYTGMLTQMIFCFTYADFRAFYGDLRLYYVICG